MRSRLPPLILAQYGRPLFRRLMIIDSNLPSPAVRGLHTDLLIAIRRETGTFYAIDWGGTNFRTACITLSKKPHKVVRSCLTLLCADIHLFVS